MKKPGANIDMKYLSYYLAAHKDEILVSLTQGVANVSLSGEKIEDVRIPLPDTVDEQMRLVQGMKEIRKA